MIRRGYSAQDEPGERYDVYSIDYGAYVDLIRTKYEPERSPSAIARAGVDDAHDPGRDQRVGGGPVQVDLVEHGDVTAAQPGQQGIGAAVDTSLDTIPLGKGELRRNGKQVAILAFGTMVAPALKAGESHPIEVKAQGQGIAAWRYKQL